MNKFLVATAVSVFAASGMTQAFAADLEPVVETVAAPAEESSSLLPGDISGYIGLYSDYRFRGLSQTDGGPSVQGGIDYSIAVSKDINFFLGAFGANIDFTSVSESISPITGAAASDGSVEFDFYGGLSGTVSDVNWSVGGLYFFYPDANNDFDQDFFEGTLAFDKDLVDGFNVGLNYNISPDFFGGSGLGNWIQGTASYSLPIEFVPLTLDGAIGYQAIEEGDNYTTWQIGLTAEIHKHLDIGVQYIDTDTSIAGDADPDIADATILGFISAKF